MEGGRPRVWANRFLFDMIAPIIGRAFVYRARLPRE
ncbi:hypothetical protein GA0115259_105172 [Streptomyces sp. MnatMP-M17]|nr:hypothetical protein GA0115259_105172 [Streptomyces sp. MnatMP-M17]